MSDTINPIEQLNPAQRFMYEYGCLCLSGQILN